MHQRLLAESRRVHSVDITDVPLNQVVSPHSAETWSFEDPAAGGRLIGNLSEDKVSVLRPDLVGWFRLSKDAHNFTFQFFAGEEGDESTLLVQDTLPLGMHEVCADDAMLELANLMIEGFDRDDPTPKPPSARSIVSKWVSDRKNESILRLAYAPLFTLIPSLRIFTLGGMTPFQAEGVIFGLPFYFRYRHDLMMLSLSSTREDIWRKPLYRSRQEYGDGSGYGGDLSGEEFMLEFPKMVQRLERSAILWEFEGVNTRDIDQFAKAGETSRRGSWGFTAEEAWESLFTRHQYEGISPEAVDRYLDGLRARGFNSQTITVDDRVYPDPEPDFSRVGVAASG